MADKFSDWSPTPGNNQTIGDDDLNIYELWLDNRHAHEAVREIMAAAARRRKYYTPQMFGAVGDGSADDTDAVQRAFDQAVSDRPGGTIHRNAPILHFHGQYRIDSTVTISNPKDIRVDATGAHFTTANDILMFDLNGLADPTYTTAESSQNFHWKGGTFKCTNGSPTKATAFRMMGFRHASLEPEAFEGWYRDIITGGKDTVYIGRYKTATNQYASIEFPPWSPIGGPLVFQIEKIHLSGDTRFIKSYVRLGDSTIRDFSCNLGTNATTDGVIDIAQSVNLGVGTISGGPFTVGETITGGTSGATMTLVEHYTHDFSFNTSQLEDWLVGSDKSVANFQTGETVTGGTSGATAVIGSDNGYIDQSIGWQNLTIEAAHWEAGSGANGATCARISYLRRRGTAAINFKIDMGACGVAGSGSTGLELDSLQDVDIRGRFAQGSGDTPISLDNCQKVKISKPSRFGTGTISLTSTDRDEVDASDFDVILRQASLIGGWGVKALSNTSATLIDMSSSFAGFETVGGLPPRAYGLTVRARDSGSTTGGGTYRFRIFHPDDTNSNVFREINVSGVPDNEWRAGGFVIGANDNGDLEYDATASGTDTMDVALSVERMLF